jgi:flap endonuclease-1
MGVQISDIIEGRPVELVELSGNRIAIDAYNTLYQFLSIIRDRFTGEPLKDSKGRVTSHLSGLFYRTINLLEAGIKPVFVFDGQPPSFKGKTIEERQAVRRDAEQKWKEAVARGEEAMKYAQAAMHLTDEMLKDSKELLDALGVPWIQAPSEGEAQCAYMCRVGKVDFAGSQDFDALLFSSPKLIRNLSISGRRKVPRKEEYVEIKPEIIELQKFLDALGINMNQLIVLGILVGTDYNPKGIKGIGPKKALQLVKEQKNLKNVMSQVEWRFDVSAEEIYEFFLHPDVTEKFKMEWNQPDADQLIGFMVDEHDFLLDRIKKVIEKLQEGYTAGRQASLKGFLRK